MPKLAALPLQPRGDPLPSSCPLTHVSTVMGCPIAGLAPGHLPVLSPLPLLGVHNEASHLHSCSRAGPYRCRTWLSDSIQEDLQLFLLCSHFLLFTTSCEASSCSHPAFSHVVHSVSSRFSLSWTTPSHFLPLYCVKLVNELVCGYDITCPLTQQIPQLPHPPPYYTLISCTKWHKKVSDGITLVRTLE